eukprot:gene26425-biopygen16422
MGMWCPVPPLGVLRAQLGALGKWALEGGHFSEPESLGPFPESTKLCSQDAKGWDRTPHTHSCP